MNPVHRCNIHCHTIPPTTLETMGMLPEDDKGKWLPFSFLMDVVIGCKLTTDDDEELVYGCTTVYTEQGDTYIIDTPYQEFQEKFYQWYNDTDTDKASSVNL